jgi:hypothetical protein
MVLRSVADPDRVGSGHFCSETDPDPGLLKRPYINFFGVCKSHKYFRNLSFLTFGVMTMLFRAYFRQKKFHKKCGLKIYFGLDLDPGPDVFESQLGSGQKSSGSATHV